MDHGGNGMPRGMLQMGSGGLLGLDVALPPHQQQMQQQARHMLPFQAAGDVGEHYPFGRHGQNVPTFVRTKQQPGSYGEAEPADDQAALRSLTQPAPAASPWQRMKWTDSMVRLLIKVVYRVGDDGSGGGAEGELQHVAEGKGKSKAGEGAAATTAMLQKKGKWKSVSRAMMETGFSVSPQQCEDKFNDLNKRYKRVNDLLGKGTACRVVENRALLDTMDHLSPKAKQEARKLLNSKHLFFREMCAYHHAGGGGSCVSAAAPLPQQVPPPSHQNPQQQQQQQQQQLCFHHSQCSRSDAKGVVSSRAMAAPVAADEEGMMMDEEVDDDDDVDSDDEEDFGDSDYADKDYLEEGHRSKRRHHPQHKHEEGEEDVDSKELVSPGRKKRRVSSQMSASPSLSLTLSSQSGAMQQLQSELMAAMPSGDGGGGEHQLQQWLQKKAAELEEQRVAYRCRAFQLERQRFNWLRFCTNKEREMERSKLENDRRRLENDRMLLLLRQKELELIQAGGGFANADHLPSTAA
ncbi:uncharacterized protein LOC122045308 [Zingiber officinale]|uniref:Myb/SANT-like DNA-binding domain-containing protein n=1 Tax=Zingiber officinale TaxID=94328 RepID=A0A8J5HFR0_ZINOF|nr:uncharacterized protein LOC122045308 [Zingiber officinale]KAG6523496.1 hypothetical protein ZIOFF_013356 [Zingiber officinale]